MSVRVDIGVVDPRRKVDLGWQVGVIQGVLDIQEENATGIG